MAKSKHERMQHEVYLDPELEVNIQDRLSRIEGHVGGIKRMLSEHQNCEDILIQMAAVKAALNQVTIKLMEGHMETCVVGAMEDGNREEALQRLRTAVSTTLRRS